MYLYLGKCELYCGLLFFISMMNINITHYFIDFGNFVSERRQLTIYSQDPSVLREDFDTFSCLISLNHMFNCTFNYLVGTGEIEFTLSETKRKLLYRRMTCCN